MPMLIALEVALALLLESTWTGSHKHLSRIKLIGEILCHFGHNMPMYGWKFDTIPIPLASACYHAIFGELNLTKNPEMRGQLTE